MKTILFEVGAVAILHNIAYIQYRTCQLEKALRSYNEALQVFKHVHNKIEVSVTLNCMGVVCFHLPKPDIVRAMDYFSKALKLRRECFEEEDKDVATILNNIGRVHYIKREYDMALVKYLESLHLRRRILGTDHLDVAATVFNAGQTFHQKETGQLYRAYRAI